MQGASGKPSMILKQTDIPELSFEYADTMIRADENEKSTLFVVKYVLARIGSYCHSPLSDCNGCINPKWNDGIEKNPEAAK